MNKNKLFVGNLPSSLSSFSLNTLFEPFGKIINVDVISESRTGRSKRFGFVTFNTPQEAKKAMDEMNNKEVEELTLVVKLVDEEEEIEITQTHREQTPIYAQ